MISYAKENSENYPGGNAFDQKKKKVTLKFNLRQLGPVFNRRSATSEC